MKEQGIAPGHNFFWQYIRLAVKNGEDVKAAQALAEMQQRGIKLDFHVLTLLLCMSACPFSGALFSDPLRNFA
jgi:hypothetical protein